MAAARGSSIVYACRAPADSVASLTALSSTPVTPLGTHTTTLGPESERRILLCGCALRMKYESIFSNLEVRYYPILQGTHRHNVARGTPEHPLRRRPHRDDLISFVVYGNH